MSLLTRCCTAAPRWARTTFTMPIPKKLNEIVRLPLFEREDPVKIRSMWLEHINEKPRSIGAVMAKPEWDVFHKNAVACPMFIVPVQKPEGYFNMVSQIQDGKYCLMTFLDHYRSNPTEAPPFMVLNFYDDLLKSKELTLLRADLVSPDLSKAEGEAVVRTLREFYGQPALFKKWVETFNLRSREFDFTEFTRANDSFFREIFGRAVRERLQQQTENAPEVSIPTRS
ncbi:hypothetical protein FOZ60_010777 [Perkinsus olseni]|uniref:ATP synthase mitochondrial F1 complex assembly factor 1 n=2 Tax=Perkinsus olseni TaxID=32597 RepID=A0A7J6NFQ1_PEROL|nr:hypothetical protein FOZ60_010777 [Perkinsus olseni]KAF4748380.1 hypothetical protein FOZ62_015288 [Perkinsus olseni]